MTTRFGGDGLRSLTEAQRAKLKVIAERPTTKSVKLVNIAPTSTHVNKISVGGTKPHVAISYALLPFP